MKYLWTALFIVTFSISILAQESCPAIVTENMMELEEVCSETGRNQLCYVNTQIMLETIEDVSFTTPGDIVDVELVSSIQTTVSDDDYGIALLVLQANLPDTLPGQNVTFLLFGDATLENADSEPLDPEETYTPMQAVYFTSGIGRSDCNDLPSDGILIQTPDSDEPIELYFNDARILLASTAYVTFNSEDEMAVYVVEGEGIVSSNNDSVVVPEGSVTTIEVDENLHAIGSPSDPVPYASDDVENLPVDSDLLADPASEETITEANVYVGAFSACWTSIDVDGSSQSMCIIPLGINLFAILAIDEGGTVCGDTGEATEFAVRLTGSGSVNDSGDVLESTITYQCLGGNNASGTVDFPLTLNADGTLTDFSGVVWSR